MKARYDIDRAKLDVDRGDTVARIENDKAKLTLADRRAAAARARGEDQVGSHLRGSRRRGEVAQAREGALRPAAGRARPAEPRAARARRRHGQHPAELPHRAACSAAASRSSAKATAPGPAPRSSSFPISRRSTSRRGSTSPIAGGSRPARTRSSGSRRYRAATSRPASTTSRCSPASTSAPGWPPTEELRAQPGSRWTATRRSVPA